jgi:hypothetical protein
MINATYHQVLKIFACRQILSRIPIGTDTA